MRPLILAVLICAAMITAAACSDAQAMPPTPAFGVKAIVAQPQGGDSIALIASWGPARGGTYGIGHYRTRLIQVPPGTVPSAEEDTLAWGTTPPDVLVDTLVVERPAIGDTLAVWFGVQTSAVRTDTTRPAITSAFTWSDPLVVPPVFVPPGPPGPVTVDTTLVGELTLRLNHDGYTVYEGWLGPTVLTASYYLGEPSDMTRIACANVLVVQQAMGAVEVARGPCTHLSVVAVDSVYVVNVNGWRSPEWLIEHFKAGVEFPPPAPTPPAS
jgi:hypothetical protein